MATAHSPRTSRICVNDHNMNERENQQPIGQRDVRKQPGLQRELQRIMIIEPILLPNEFSDLIHHDALALIQKSVQVGNLIEPLLQRAANFEQVLQPVLWRSKKRFQMFNIK